ncbi:hypothetical protein H5410_061557 [Solanum commersonii]|uniref:ARID domain-containing protein n=1 Tax=Solanum commersonii TaxID=4109 RepID=A0A9J5W8Z6_SOLCO|nr:hypothetical protein H5410_061557 [Solanum commersonii]
MDKDDVEMVDAESYVPASDILVSNESPVKCENSVISGKRNVEDKIDDQSYLKGEDSKNARSELEDHLNSESKPEAHDNVVLEKKLPTIDAGIDDMISGYTKVIDDEVQNIEKMIYEVNQNGNDLMVDRQEDSQMKKIPTNVTTDSSIGKMPEPASPMFPSTVNVGQHSGEASKNICTMMVDREDDEGSPEDQSTFIGKLGTFYREKVMKFKLPKFYGHPLNCLKKVLWTSVIKLGGYDRVTGLKLWQQVGESFNPPKDVDAEENVPASDVLLSNESPPEAHDNVVLEEKMPTIDAGTDDMNGNDLMVATQDDPQMKTNATTFTTDGDARSDEFPKVKIVDIDSSIGKMPEPASLMFLINPSTTIAGQHSGESSKNQADGEDDEGSPEDKATFIGKLGTFYQEKAMEFKQPRFYGHQLNCLKLWRSVIRLGGYDWVSLLFYTCI